MPDDAPRSRGRKCRPEPQPMGHASRRSPHSRRDARPPVLEALERKHRVLTQGAPSMVRSIADAVVIKDEGLFCLSRQDGTVPLVGEHGLGLYYHDCRYLDGYELRLAGRVPNSLAADSGRGFQAIYYLTNPDLHGDDGALVPQEQIGLRWHRQIDALHSALDELIVVENYGLDPVAFPMTLAFSAGFDDVFAVRGMLPASRGRLSEPEWHDGVLVFRYAGGDGLHRGVGVHFAPSPDAIDGTTARFDVRLAPREAARFVLTIDLSESTRLDKALSRPHRPADLKRVEQALDRSVAEWRGAQPQLRTDSLLVDRVLERSFRDLRALRSRLHGHDYFAAGIPWFATLFGRDSLIAALQMLPFDLATAADTLRLLARLQGRITDAYHDEEPGKILHEFRCGELARTGEIPHSPYYGTVDATPLFLVLLARHASWTGRLDLFQELRGSVDRALEWIESHGDSDGDGYIEYRSASESGLVNQGWKDSGDAIVNADGRLARPPIALVEVQGYAFQARLVIAELFERSGEPERAARLRRDAGALRRRFNHDFWLADRGAFALALQANKEPCAVIASNPGHALWSGIADPEQARLTVERLMADDMFNGWGIRTLASTERVYNPLGYHRGTVWPHDNSLIAAGFRRYGFDTAARRMFVGLLTAAMSFEHQRLPELFGGFDSRQTETVVRYPVACHPQAWAAGTMPYLMTSLLGLEPDAFERRLRVIRPILPPMMSRLDLLDLRVGDARTDLRFTRQAGEIARLDVLAIEGPLDVVVSVE